MPHHQLLADYEAATFTLIYPQKLLFGWGTFEQLGQEAVRLGTRALLVCGRRAMRRQGVLDRALRVLAESGVEAATFEEVASDPSLATVNRGAEKARKCQSDVVIGLGGGSAIDAAKAIAQEEASPADASADASAGASADTSADTSAGDSVDASTGASTEEQKEA